jgi:hypothetical protein
VTKAEALRRRGDMALTLLLVAAVAILLMGALISVFSVRSDYVGWDLRTGYLPAADAVREGASPYPDPADPELDLKRAYVYPPQLAIALVPLSGLPVDFATLIVLILSLAAIVGSLALVGVRDLRCYTAVLLWAPTWNALSTLNVSAGMALGAALVWRYRSTLWPLAAAVGLMVSIKLVAWPLAAWLALTRRLGAAVLGLAIGVAVTFVSWAAIGFAGIGNYRELLSKVEAQENYSLVALTVELGLGTTSGHVVSALVGLTLLAVAVGLWRTADHERSYVLTIVAMLVMSPVIWLHYLTSLIAPLGVMRPSFSAIWLLPIVLWISPRDENGAGLHPYLPAVFVAAFVVLMLVSWSPRRPVALGVLR